MTTGASFPSFTASAAYAMTSGSAHADYPVTNLSDLKRISRPFRASAAGSIAFSFVLDADQDIEFLALCWHNGADGETWQIELFDDDALSSSVYDSGALTFDLDPASPFKTVTPHRLPDGPLTIRGGIVTLSAMSEAWQIGCLEVSGFWDLTDHDAHSRGIRPKDELTEVGEGVTHGMRQFSPRVFTLGNSLIEWADEGPTLLDFQMEKGTSEPFVFVRDYDDATTWARECALVRNASLPALAKDRGVYGARALDMLEHLQ